jgi:hypothetical protein
MDILQISKDMYRGRGPYVMTYAKIAYKPDTQVLDNEDKVAKHHTDKKF